MKMDILIEKNQENKVENTKEYKPELLSVHLLKRILMF